MILFSFHWSYFVFCTLGLIYGAYYYFFFHLGTGGLIETFGWLEFVKISSLCIMASLLWILRPVLLVFSRSILISVFLWIYWHVDLITEILRVSGLAPSQSFLDHERLEQGSPLSSVSLHSNCGPMDLEGWAGMQTEVMFLSIITLFSCFLLEHLIFPRVYPFFPFYIIWFSLGLLLLWISQRHMLFMRNITRTIAGPISFGSEGINEKASI